MANQYAPQACSVPLVTSRADFWRAVLELMKPLTWFAPMWAFLCGAISSGAAPTGEFLWNLFLGAILAGPLMCSMSQVMNDYCDREVDRINEPQRPFPSGRITESQGLWLCTGLTLGSFGLAWIVGAWPVLLITIAAFVMSLLYSAPPVRGKRNGWFGNGLVSFAYEGVAWATGCLAVSGAFPPASIAGAVLYSIGAHGIMTLNDFKSVPGDTALGIRSVPVQLGIPRAARVACYVMNIPQLLCVGLLAWYGEWLWAAVLMGLLVAQIPLQVKLVRDPEARAPWYNATGTTLYVLGMMAYAIAIR
ncbi:chlorophyll synthase ChlG [Chloracidobacterium aggregatum]|jgi:chlorophyll synthase|uniref:Chlorophyll synthase ChlG n=1 Tax=Chloracidobacterium sp. N TaxID=2821540 RepID=A0ABX8B1I2_9BACT|nr:chlorophyll synthase ChlG [Chloracidobacterium aggregatum]QUV84198.1 chlorophyll synthase ChlG [Chloracidobacterium sp. 2]QUV87317.1 chlorophyll synthase ChlG [Chloracidobacterium sp. S]QUV90221.1 chlorophyll synthase ChlG [Chloracidobacterium sp. A]QUV93431.1 chlorophyll synthase ChlG [Chloracidobacterium sp. N]QUV96588.1 chlorophyll synthase ChlG [Chloracidobacterium sp. E]